VHTEELHDLSSDIINRDDLEAGYATRLGKRKVHASVWLGNVRDGAHLEDLGVDWKIILKLSFKEQNFEGTFC
jgi:hypothetical protein